MVVQWEWSEFATYALTYHYVVWFLINLTNNLRIVYSRYSQLSRLHGHNVGIPLLDNRISVANRCQGEGWRYE